MPQEDDSASELNHPEEILWVVFPANDDHDENYEAKRIGARSSNGGDIGAGAARLELRGPREQICGAR